MKHKSTNKIALLSALMLPVAVMAQDGAATENTSTVSSAETVPAPTMPPVVDGTAATVSESNTVSSTAAATETSTTELSEIKTETPPAAEVAAVAVPTAAEPAKDTLSVDFPDEDIRSILRNVADLFELNIVVPDTLVGRTSIKLRDVTWRQIFSVVLTPVGYTFIEEGNIIKVITIDSLALEPLSTEVYILNYAKAKEVEKSILPLVDSAAGGRVLVDERINALIISERSSKLSKIGPVLKSLDKVTEQVMIEAKFINVDANKLDNFGIEWQTAQGTLVDGSANSTYSGAGNFGGYADNFNYVTSVLSSFQLEATLNVLQAKGNTKVVSNPTLVTLNNTEAFINVGEEFPIPSYTYNSERGVFEVSGFEYKPIGIILKVTPQINNDKFIKLSVAPEVSRRGANVDFNGAAIPIISTSKTKTEVSLKDGHTLAIGGLIRDQTGTDEQRIPILGSIPGIGRLFRSDQTDVSTQNLMIFITAKIVSADSARPQDIFSSSQIRDAKIKRSEIGGHRDDTDPFLPEVDPTTPVKEKK